MPKQQPVQGTLKIQRSQKQGLWTVAIGKKRLVRTRDGRYVWMSMYRIKERMGSIHRRFNDQEMLQILTKDAENVRWRRRIDHVYETVARLEAQLTAILGE